MTLEKHLARLREIMADFPPLEAHTPSTEIDPADIYFPKSHAAALDPNRSLVVGNRGMGKSFWANALVQENARRKIAEAFPEAKLGSGKIHIHFGFADAEGAVGVSRDELVLHLEAGFVPETIWRAVTVAEIARRAGYTTPSKLSDRLAWVRDEPAEVREILRAADQALSEQSETIVFVFDQLEQLSDDFDKRRLLTQGILRLALAFKSYRCLRIKIFMRPDQRADRKLFTFPDASKISGEEVALDWRPQDLYGLLYMRLHRADRSAFRLVAKSAGIEWTQIDEWADLPRSLVTDSDRQWSVFNHVAGEFMGSPNRGRPYSWLVLHLADARNQISPRTFLRALKVAAEHDPAPSGTAINHHGINEGVRKASANRVDDLKEDYPWVNLALYALKPLTVPCDPAMMQDRWRDGEIVARLKTETPPAKTPPWLAAACDDDDPSLEALMAAMADIGVIERRLTTGKVDVPDIFRLPADLRRRGGVTPQQRRQARVR